MDSYKIDTSNEGESIGLDDGEGELFPASASDNAFSPEEKTKLSEIIKALNEAFNTEFDDDDKVFLKRVKDNMMSNEELAKKIHNNSKENVAAIFDRYFDKELNKHIQSNFDFFKKINDNDLLKEDLKNKLLDVVYDENK
ncbi:hypothetical protein [Methanobrevibacter olleyae]|uniref:Type I site-specific restriction-modification system R subunit n=1 Tax=Methanobrevibacter olleyae TaxID=294671 RepID=A0A126R0C3_METOL|nr:hypothetical protein [Methanobrevibacter olleyae]AMK15496.1 type I site-specific restriction-modification system R subunit [Methanobrevibacter olleyae]